MSLFDTAVRFALKRHEGQEYGKGTGIPYGYHLHEVDQIFIKRNGFGFNDTARIVVWLHDVVEDTDTTLEEIAELFGPRIAHSVDCLTKRKGEAYEVYLVRVNSDDTACEVKFCDSSMNMMQSIKEGNFERALKYLGVLKTLRFIPAGGYKW
ncbi:GTP pyrophosphokinase [Pseudomonas phage vB_PF_Y1-MI]|nr:GTP pyrophosphokinase [Pseudomonas phage vB_PF_Y1-MI]